MKLNELKNNPGALKAGKRAGRGAASGIGRTGGRGMNGQKSRSGVAIKGFEGGQMPIHRRLPKRGFNNVFAKQFNVISVGRIQKALDDGRLEKGQTVTADTLKASGLIRRVKDGVRLLNDGELKDSVTFEIAGASKAAIAAVEKAGGSVTLPAAGGE